MVVWDKFKKLWPYYIFQSTLAGVAIFVIVLVFQESFVIISSMGATAFICFALPKNVSAQTRHVIGGHLVGLCSGAIFMLTGLPDCVEIPLAVGLAIFFMVALDLEHPPAAGTAVAVVINHVVTLPIAIAIILSALLISQCRYMMRKFLKDLL
jgi:CBS-domain-containing membrane protein